MSGSFKKSYCPWSTLCPISMFSTIFEYESRATPATQAGKKVPKNSSARPAISAFRWRAMVPRI